MRRQAHVVRSDAFVETCKSLRLGYFNATVKYSTIENSFAFCVHTWTTNTEIFTAFCIKKYIFYYFTYPDCTVASILNPKVLSSRFGRHLRQYWLERRPSLVYHLKQRILWVCLWLSRKMLAETRNRLLLSEPSHLHLAIDRGPENWKAPGKSPIRRFNSLKLPNYVC